MYQACVRNKKFHLVVKVQESREAVVHNITQLIHIIIITTTRQCLTLHNKEDDEFEEAEDKIRT